MQFTAWLQTWTSRRSSQDDATSVTAGRLECRMYTQVVVGPVGFSPKRAVNQHPVTMLTLFEDPGYLNQCCKAGLIERRSLQN